MTGGPLADRMRGHLGDVGNADTDHIPVPSGHAPRLSEHAGAGRGVTLHEPGVDGAWMTCEKACSRVVWE